MSPDSEADLAACRRPAMSCQPRSGQRSTQPLATHRSACHRLSMVRSRIRLPEWSLTSMKRGGRCRTWAPAKKAGTKRSNTSEYSPTPSGPCTEHTPLTHCLRRRTRTRQDQKAEIQSSGKFVKIEAGAVFMWLSGEGKDRRGWSDPATNCSSSRKSSSLPSVCAHEYDGIREIRASLRNSVRVKLDAFDQFDLNRLKFEISAFLALCSVAGLSEHDALLLVAAPVMEFQLLHSATLREKKPRCAVDGIKVAAFCLVLLGLCIAGLVVSAADESPVLVSICSVGIALAVVLGFSGIVMLSPNEAAVLQLFGRYEGTIHAAGLSYVTPFVSVERVSLRVQTFESSQLKVNDADGNPIEIAAIVT
ncbi:hypothetical protein T484DRAFT_3644901 [Baffinella frigidus]|nr:hypothetical protein T484DRAFT_3644901 [Cryptophyta sp. CCMP2293]